jgi:serine/threonine protein kinase
MVVCGSCRAKNFITGDLAPMETTPCSKCGHPVMLPFRMRQFELRSVIASGGMATVFRAFDLNLEREVAIKLLKKEMAADPEVLKSFYREARVIAALNHTNILHVYTFDEFEGEPYIAMEIADNGSLDSRIEAEGHVQELVVLDVAVKIADALASANKHNILHRDIKPGNILFNCDNEPKLMDFGLGGTEAHLDSDSAVYGTPQYIAPEKLTRGGETFLSDMYSLGATLYHSITGQVPFPPQSEDPEEAIREMSIGHTETPVTPPNHLVRDISAATNEAIYRSLAKNPADRFQSYDEFKMAFEAARTHLLIERYRQ